MSMLSRSLLVTRNSFRPTPVRTTYSTLAIAAAFSVQLILSFLSASGCATFAPGVARGTVSIPGLKEASGLAASRANPGVLWTHNDGPGGAVHAIGMNGAHLATFYLNNPVIDTEDIAVGPGPDSGVSYLYVGDIGGNHGRREVQVLRIPEPYADTAWAGAPQSSGFSSVEVFTLIYPDGSYNAESLMIDPVSHDVFVVTKQDDFARVYRANVDRVPSGARVRLLFVTAARFSKASGGDISADGAQIVLRREDFAMQWDRSAGESVGTALARPGQAIPVIGPPTEPNGEAIALLPDGRGYFTVSEGVNPVLYFFEAQCPMPPRFTLRLADQSVISGETVNLVVRATGNPAPTYLWRRNGVVIPGQARRFIVLRHVTPAQAGLYVVTAINSSGRVASRARLSVSP